MTKIVYVISGFMESTKFKTYKKIIKFFKENYFTVIPIEIKWKHNTMSNYVEEFHKQVKHKKEDKVYIFGFSFGAMISIISSNKIKPEKMFLCSLSPYFEEDLHNLKRSWKTSIGRKRFNDFKKYSFSKLSKTIKCETILFVGENEPFEVRKRVFDAHKKIKKSKFIEIENTSHNISQKEYLEKIFKSIN